MRRNGMQHLTANVRIVPASGDASHCPCFIFIRSMPVRWQDNDLSELNIYVLS